MTTAAHHPDPARRFGLTLVATSVAVAVVALIIFRQSPMATLQPQIISQQSGVAFEQSSVAGASNGRVNNVLSRFVAGLERDDAELMRKVFPTMTSHDVRILHSLRRRLGEQAHLGVSTLHLRSATPTDAEVDFVIVSQKADYTRVRMPFTATMHRQGDRWVISSLH